MEKELNTFTDSKGNLWTRDGEDCTSKAGHWRILPDMTNAHILSQIEQSYLPSPEIPEDVVLAGKLARVLDIPEEVSSRLVQRLKELS